MAAGEIISPPSDASRASVVIPTRDKARYLALTLASFSLQTTRAFELVVVDDGSGDDTQAVLDQSAERLPLRRFHQPPRGRAAARNTGLAAAQAEIVIFCDDDRIVTPDFVAKHLEAQSKRRGLIIGEPRCISSPGRFTSQELVNSFDAIALRFGSEERWWRDACLPAVAHHGPHLTGFLAPWMMCRTSNLSVPRRDLVAVGGFDEAFHGWGLEDVELCYRLHRAGLSTTVERAAVNYHQEHPKTGDPWAELLVNLRHFTAKHDTVEVALYAELVRAGSHDLQGFNARLVAALSSH
jgi:glycosyltransferase involved in cell wall biosynthesis